MYYEIFFDEGQNEEQFNPIRESVNFVEDQPFDHKTYQLINQKQNNQFNITTPIYFSMQQNSKLNNKIVSVGQQNMKEEDQAQQQVNTMELFKRKQSKLIRQIKTSGIIKQRFLKSAKGNKTQTTELNINLKTITKNILEDLIRLKEFSKNQKQKIEIYKASNANFHTTQSLFGVSKQFPNILKQQTKTKSREKIKVNALIHPDADKIRKKCFEQYSKSRFIKLIFKSEKMALKNKLTILKFVENIRQSPAFPVEFSRWKCIFTK